MYKVKMNLEGLDGNAFNLIGAFKRNARIQKIDPEWTNKIINEMMESDYDNLLCVLADNTEPEDEE